MAKRIQTTARSTAWLKRQGFIVANVEKRVHIPPKPGEKLPAFQRPVTRDVWGFGDLLASHPEHGIALIQVTGASHVSDRVRKITQDVKVSPFALNWLRAGGLIIVHGWGYRGPSNERQIGLRQQRITEADFSGEIVTQADVILTGKKAKAVVVDRVQGKLF